MKHLTLTSTAFEEGQEMPRLYTADGEDISPPLRWSGVPEDARNLVLICDDPDAPMGTWVHWLLYGLQAGSAELPANIPASEYLPNGARQGLNDFRRVGYGGPAPPPGPMHRYVFRLYAVNSELALRPRATRGDLLGAIEGRVMAEGRLTATYQRR